ncbi:hypothetical protein [Rickettsiella endosymbiont of Aleochara curtula]|uniref:hypothetical protein n=1 Tax=Rickettsiella endosymbiont of Aleochara curtula TaxID=3077936 RepID=UPI00313D4B8D
MPNNENNYRIQLEFASFLRGLPGFRITGESVGFVSVEISQVQRYHPHYIIDQLFKELEKDYVDHEELMCIGRIIRKYLRLLKQIDTERTYYTVTPGMMTGLFIVLHLAQVFFPDNTGLIYCSLVADLYALGFWIFSVWSLSQHEQNLTVLEDKLKEKISFLRSLSSSLPLMVENFYGSAESIPPPYENVLEDVLLEDSMSDVERYAMPTVFPRVSSFFYPTLNNDDCNDSNNDTDPREKRCYSI